MRGNRITSATGGTLRGDIAKFVTADPDPVAEVRIDNPTVTRTEQILNAPPPTSTGAYSSGAVNQITIPPGAGGFILAPGEGIALNTGAGDTAQRWNFSVVWVEQTL